MRTGRTLLINENLEARWRELGAKSITPGTKGLEKSTLWVPLLSGGEVRGAICVFDMNREHAFSESQVRLLETVAGAMSVALDNARLFDETQRLFKESEQRAAELAIINSVQEALAAQLSIQGIYDAVGDKIREIFHQADVGIRMYDPQTQLIHFPYQYQSGKRLSLDAIALPATGYTAHILRTRETVFVNEDAEGSMKQYGSVLIPGARLSKSFVYVPLIAGDRVHGLIELKDVEHEHAFKDSDVRLLQTLASAMSAALENARLFDETRRLFKESEQRAAELAIINSVQEALASKLDIDAIYMLVGEKVREVFAADTAFIRYLSPDGKVIATPYHIDRGSKTSAKRFAPYDGKGLTGVIIRSGKPLLIGTGKEQDAQGAVDATSMATGEDFNETFLGVPIFRDGAPYGLVSVQSYKQHAYRESDVRLLTTLANTMGVALQNVELFDETQRLFKESEQRAAELAIINSVQEGLASKLDVQAIFGLVGDKIGEIFKADTTFIVRHDLESNTIVSCYMKERGDSRSARGFRRSFSDREVRSS
jgi:GAF domain-containing protein